MTRDFTTHMLAHELIEKIDAGIVQYLLIPLRHTKWTDTFTEMQRMAPNRVRFYFNDYQFYTDHYIGHWIGFKDSLHLPLNAIPRFRVREIHVMHRKYLRGELAIKCGASSIYDNTNLAQSYSQIFDCAHVAIISFYQLNPHLFMEEQKKEQQVDERRDRTRDDIDALKSRQTRTYQEPKKETAAPAPPVLPANDPEAIARICHQANKAYCEAIGDLEQVNWEDAPEHVQRSVVDGVLYKLNNPGVTPEQSHENWLRFKQQEGGWQYGPVKDIAAKVHPCYLPYAELPAAQRKKDVLFTAIVKALM